MTMSHDSRRELFSEDDEEADPHVLIVDDDEPVRELLALRLGTDFTVESIADGEECLSYLRDEDTPIPDVMTLDRMFPNRKGSTSSGISVNLRDTRASKPSSFPSSDRRIRRRWRSTWALRTT